MYRQIALSASVALLVMHGCKPAPEFRRGDATERGITSARALLGVPTIALLQSVSEAETFRVENGSVKPGTPGVAGCKILYKGKTQGKVFPMRLARLIAADKTYTVDGEFNPSYLCIFEPFVAYRLRSGRQVVEVCLCFHCGEWSIWTKNDEGKVTHRAFGVFKGSRAELVALTKQAFPRDKAVRSLSVTKSLSE